MSPEFLSYRGLNIQFCLFSLFYGKDLISNIWWHLLILFLFCLSYTMKPVSCFLWLVRVMKLFQECWSVNICSELIKMRFLKNKINPSYMPLLTGLAFFSLFIVVWSPSWEQLLFAMASVAMASDLRFFFPHWEILWDFTSHLNKVHLYNNFIPLPYCLFRCKITKKQNVP